MGTLEETMADLDANQLKLSSGWCFWEHQHSGSYNCQPLGSCDNIGSFWRLFNNLPEPRAFFATKSDSRRKLVGQRKVDSISLFREGVKPEWEDPQNCNGGELLFRSEKLDLMNKLWYELVLVLVGEAISPTSGIIMGARILDKSAKGKVEYRVEVWYGEGVDSQELIMMVQSSLKQSIGCNNLSFSVRSHNATLQKNIDKVSKGKPKAKYNGSDPQGSGSIPIPTPAPLASSRGMRTVHLAA